MMEKLVEAGSDVICASNTLMLMLVGEVGMSKPSIETACRRALEAQAAWDAALENAGLTEPKGDA